MTDGIKDSFPGYFRPTKDEFAKLWENATFAFDANVLLHSYRYSESARSSLLELISSLGDRIWVPHQFAEEFFRNRANVILEQAGHYDKAARDLRDLLDERLKKETKHPFLDKKMIDSLEEIHSELVKGSERHEDLLDDDPGLNEICEVFDGLYGTPFSTEDLSQKHEEIQRRYNAKVPPGFLDTKKKGVPDCYGDCLGWFQILNHSMAQAVDVILVTDDAKEDWWNIQKGKKIGPRPELIAEFRAKCDRQFYMYSTYRFMEHAKLYLNHEIDEITLDEIRQQQEERSEAGGQNKLKASKSTVSLVGSQSKADAPKKSAPIGPPESMKDSTSKPKGARGEKSSPGSKPDQKADGDKGKA